MKDTLGQNEKLRVSEELKSTNGKYTLEMQEDGNLSSSMIVKEKHYGAAIQTEVEP